MLFICDSNYHPFSGDSSSSILISHLSSRGLLQFGSEYEFVNYTDDALARTLKGPHFTPLVLPLTSEILTLTLLNYSFSCHICGILRCFVRPLILTDP